jgi:signal transduction histidine kinase
MLTLRARLLALFAALAVVPLLAVGGFDYLRSVRAVEALIIGQTSSLATQGARDLSDRLQMFESNAALLAENDETRRMFIAKASGESTWVAQRITMERFLADAWPIVGRDLLWVSYRSTSGDELFRLGHDTYGASGVQSRQRTLAVRDDNARVVGEVVVGARMDSLVSAGSLQTHFGRNGLSAVRDDSTDAIMSSDVERELAAELTNALTILTDVAQDSSTPALSLVEFRQGDSAWIGARVPIGQSGLSVISLASRNEFFGPFEEIRTSNLIVVILLTLLVATAFVILLQKGLRPLAMLTNAADQVARGDMEPRLPNPGADETGRLSTAFGLMLTQLRGMFGEVERSRQMAAIGEFAAQISHEIRNPLTAIKLNLQKLDRAAHQGRVPDELRRPVEISLTEIDRLDRVVRGVLQLGHASTATRTRFSLRDVVVQALDATRPAIERRDVRIIESHDAGNDFVSGDAEQLMAMVMNLLINAAEAMDSAGAIHVMVSRQEHSVRLRVEDDGGGIALEDRDRIFAPFVTTKRNGTGLGLALAQRTIEAHHGTIAVVEPVRGTGAAIEVTLPLAHGESA